MRTSPFRFLPFFAISSHLCLIAVNILLTFSIFSPCLCEKQGRQATFKASHYRLPFNQAKCVAVWLGCIYMHIDHWAKLCFALLLCCCYSLLMHPDYGLDQHFGVVVHFFLPYQRISPPPPPPHVKGGRRKIGIH